MKERERERGVDVMNNACFSFEITSVHKGT